MNKRNMKLFHSSMIPNDKDQSLHPEIVQNVTDFLEESCAGFDKKILKNMAVALTKRLNDTSPGTLRDVTMDNSYGVGYMTPCVSLQNYRGSTSPATQGRSVREFEEQMVTLRKENFNLKLRLFFLEESVPFYKQASSNPADGNESLMKQLIDVKVEREILRKEVQEKQELLQEAALGMTRMEKEIKTKYQDIVDELTEKLNYLEMERDIEKSHATNSNSELMNDFAQSQNDVTNANLRDMDELIRQSEEKVNSLQSQIDNLNHAILMRDETIKEYEEKVKELAFQNAELLESVENRGMEAANEEAHHLREELQKANSELADTLCGIQDLEEQLQSRNNLYEKARFTIQKLLLNERNLQKEISRLKQNTSETANNTNNENTQNTGLESTGDYGRSLSDTEAFVDLSAAQKQKYESIIKEQGIAIQTLNAEIKKKTSDLQSLVNRELREKNLEIERLTKLVANSTSSPVGQDQHSELQKSFTDLEYAEAIQRNKLLQRKVDLLIQRLDAERCSEAIVSQLRIELSQARADSEKADKWRRSLSELCVTLFNRLKELAGFLDVLLKHKDVLGVLATDKRRAMRKAVDRSLDLSNSLNMTLSVSSISMIDQSLVELHNLTDILAEVEGMENKTFNSHEELHGRQSIETLKTENKALKKELDKRRSVECRKERRSLPLHLMADNQSESEAWSEPDRNVSLARIGLEDHSASLHIKEPATSSAQHHSGLAATTGTTDSDENSEAAAMLDSRKTRASERILQLEQIIAQRDKRISEIQCKLHETDNLLINETMKVAELSEELKRLCQQNEKLHTDLLAIGTQQQEPMHNETLLMQEIEDKTRLVEKIEEERERLSVEARLAENQIIALKSDMEELNRQHNAILEQQQYQLKTECAEKLQQQEKQFEERLQRDWIAKYIYEECKEKLIELQKLYSESIRSIDSLQENEQELKQTLVESELASRNLQKQLDESTLQSSKAILERTKALNDKLQLEKRVEELQQQITKFENEKSELKEQLVFAEAEHAKISQQLAKISENIRQARTAVKHEDNASGYTSEEIPAANNFNIVGQQRMQNPSPDLGIESDAGRMSSVEVNNASVSQSNINATIKEELNDSQEENMKPLNSAATANGAAAAGQHKAHDCAKVDQEIYELRRKLQHTTRAFEKTYEKLRTSNERKALVEKSIKNELLKTHKVLRNARSNMEMDK